MAQPYHVVKLMTEDEFSLLSQQWLEDDAIPSHCPVRVISEKGEADID